MVLYLIGLGLGDEKDITVKGLEAAKKCSKLYLEHYTSVLGVDYKKLEAFYEREVILADRELIESEVEAVILEPARNEDIGLLVVGDPFGATTHADLVLRAKQMGIEVKVIHNASIMNAIASCGLQLYNFGQTISMVFFDDNWRPESWYPKILSNTQAGLHTLCLLDIKMKEQSLENLMRGRKVYEPPRFMTIRQCIEQLLEVEDKRKENAYSRDSLCIGVARLGRDDQLLVAGSMQELMDVDFGPPLHSFVIAGTVHPLEQEFVDSLRLKKGGPPTASSSTSTSQ
jgi:diphthine synthase